jgi:putative oxidoreductase
MNRLMSSLAGLSGCAFLALRLVMAEILISSGYRKFFVMGLDTVTGNFDKWGMPIPQLTAPFIGALELVGGILLAVGLFTRYLGVLFTVEFIVATWVQWVQIGNGYMGSRLDTMILVTAIVMATHGAGRFSLDAKLGRG